MSLLRAVAALPFVARNLAANGRFVTVKQSGYLGSVVPRLGEDKNLVTFGLGEVCVVHLGQLRLGGLGAQMLPHLPTSLGSSKVALQS